MQNDQLPNPQPHFTIIYDTLIDDLSIGAYEKVVYLVINRYAGETKTAFPDHALIARKAGCSVTSVKMAINNLIDHGYLTREQRDRVIDIAGGVL